MPSLPWQHTIPLKSPTRTPTSSPQKRAITITEAQKRALIDNLQLEVTERARKLRAQYALQAQSLRTRIELRINRIPSSLRRTKMGDLFEKHLEKAKQADNGRPESKSSKPPDKPFQVDKQTAVSCDKENASAPTRVIRGSKRKSDVMESADKENDIDHIETLPIPKKRTKITANEGVRKATTPSTVLSPKSSNSRTLPQSPIRPLPQKPYLSYPTSPLKPMPPIKVALPLKPAAIKAVENTTSVISEKARPTRAKANTERKATNSSTVKPAATNSKRGGTVVNALPTEARSASNSSYASNTSTGTTIKKRGGKTINAAATVATGASRKKHVNVGVNSAAKISAGISGAAPPVERRVLRKRV